MYDIVAGLAAKNPSAVAICGPVHLSYAELIARADVIARTLWQAGLRPGGRAGLLLDRSADAVAAMLAIARLGAAYVPIDPALPLPTRDSILADAKVTLILARQATETALQTIRLDQSLPSAPALSPLAASDPHAAAYVMYTSGSTGTPKGVVVPWRGVLRLVQEPDYVRFSPADVILHAAPLGFDASTFEIWGALLNGAQLAIVPDSVPSLDTIAGALDRYGVTIAWLTSGLFHAMVDARLGALAKLRQLLAGGDVLSPPHVARALAALPDTTLINGYGPTENTTFTCCYHIPRDHAADAPVPIGRPIRGTVVWLLNEQGEPVADGEEGELCAGGDGVALGYLNRPQATAAAFAPGPDGSPMYRTGDRARRLADGTILFAGRKDRQVKIRGKRVSLDDMEAELLRDPAVREVAIVFESGRATAFVTGQVDASNLRRTLLARLPEHMVPAVINPLGAMPLTRNGKLDRKALPAAPGTAARLAQIWRAVLGREIAAEANLFDAGVSSLDIVRAHAAMADAGLPVSLTDLFAYPSNASLAAHLDGIESSSRPTSAGVAGGDIAIIGMAGRFPGAPDLDTFWDNLCTGVESITRFAPDALQDAYAPETRADPAFVAARPILEGIDQFDPAFFSMTRREAELTDPQHRLFLEIAWEALETAGQDPANYAGRVGVFAGSSPNSYLLRNVLADRAAVLRYTSDYQTGSYPALLGAGADFLATRVAYKLDLRGPAVTVATACSTALVAVAQACAALRAGETDMALAGGVSITLPQHRGYLHEPGGLASADGHVRPFDAAASGTVFGSGAAIVLLKRLAEAQADGDHIHAVLRGVATNNDGGTKVGFTAPSVGGQAACIVAAQAQANVIPASIGYVEAHGTATPLGDPIELAALRQAWGADAAIGQCVLGSVKGNIGHLDAASGAAGLIKAALTIERATIPGTLHFRTPNPAMSIETSPFRVSAETATWAAASPRRAAVSSFGVGGTNAHAIIEQAPVRSTTPDTSARQVLLLSARSPSGLADACARLARHVENHPEQSLTNVAWTLQTARRRFPHRAALLCTNRADAIDGLRTGRAITSERSGDCSGVAFLFPGQGAQYPGMGRALYQSQPVFRDAIERCAAILQPHLETDLRNVLYPEAGDDAAAAALTNTALAQPALFATSYATARFWMANGILPVAMLGHSVGEFVAACLAGVFSLEDALGLVAARGRLMGSMPPGEMLSVRLPEAELLPLLGDTLDLAASNAPSLCVAAGPAEEIERLEAKLQARAVPSRRLHTSHAFHSRAMDGVATALRDAVASVALAAPTIPLISGVSGDWITAAEATSPDYWAGHCRAPVRFAAGLSTLWETRSELGALLECGPGRGLTQLALASGWRGGKAAVISSLPEATSAASADESIAEAIGRLWLAGTELDWAALCSTSPDSPRRVPLPPTPWEKTRCWIDEPTQISSHVTEPETEMAQTSSNANLSDLIALFEELSGERLVGIDPTTTFIQLGFDSLFLGQVAQQVRSRFGVAITFRQLLGDCGSFGALALHVDAGRPKTPDIVTAAVPPRPTPSAAVASAEPSSTPSGAAALMQQQVQAMSALFAQQLAALGTSPAPSLATAITITAPAAENTTRFDAFKVVAGNAGTLTSAGLAHVRKLVDATTARTPRSKQLTAEARSYLADPRAAAGFRPEWKEMTYPIVAVRSAGPHIWDADGNKYVDLVNGFGQTAFGHAPPFVVEAVKRQLDCGFEIGPQAELAGRVAARFCAMTSNERMTFCNTGSEAVMAAMRIARTVTGRSRIVTFAGSYHGQFDEVLVKAGPKGTRPVAPGIPLESVSNITVLEYGTEASLVWIREHADDLAAAIVEPVQSRHPALQPRAFLAELRAITEQSGTCLVFDEVVTGFRTHPGGMQAIFNIRADLATYGKVVGGGLPIGILAGKAAFMDALDGGTWQYGDSSMPESAVTFFAGTFVRHPLALAAMEAVLNHVETAPPAMYTELAERTGGLADRLNRVLAAHGLPQSVEHYASWFYFKLSDPFASLLYPNMRLRGVHIQEGFPCFLTTTHGQAEIDSIAEAFTQSLATLQSAGLLRPAGIAEPSAITENPSEAPLTAAQMEIWLAAQLGDAASCAFNESVSLDLRGPLDVTALRSALDRVLARHDALRARFTPEGDRMVISPWESLALDVDDEPLEAVLEQDARTPFDLVAGPPIRLRLVRRARDHHVLVLTAHHIVCDGWSINTLLSELASPRDLSPALSFASYATQKQAARSQSDVAWWAARFAESPAPLHLPSDRARPAMRSFRGGMRRLELDLATLNAVKRAGAAQGCTLFTTLLAAVGILMGRLAAQQDLIIAVPAAAQSQLEDQVLVGHCANLLPIRISWNDDMPFDGYLHALRQAVLDAYEHQDCTLGSLVQTLRLARTIGRLPLADVQFNLERLGEGLEMAGMEVSVRANAKAFVNFDLFFNAVESSSSLAVECDYNADLFDADTIDRWLGHLSAILGAISADITQPTGTLPLMTAAEHNTVLRRWNDTEAAVPPRPVHQLIEVQAARRPAAPAARFGDVILTYRALDDRANQLAHVLAAQTKSGDRIAVMLDRSPDMLAVLLGAWKAGLAYVPLDPSHPPARLQHILHDADVALLICDGTGPSLNAPSFNLQQNAALIDASPTSTLCIGNDLHATAYVIYTSGSTGLPKGVAVDHLALGNLLLSIGREPGICPDDVWLAVTTIGFDIAGLELFGPLVAGAQVAVASREEASDGYRLLEVLAATKATIMQATPATWRLLLEAGFKPGELCMLCGGEALPRTLADQLLVNGGPLWNMYGPTETTIWSSLERIGGGPITIGHPVANTTLHILDTADRMQPIGVPGQLHIGGAGLAQGYRNRPDLTATRFIANPFSAQGQLYRTGDLARRLPDGRIQVLGRMDGQIKLRGYRMEPGEIEHILTTRCGLAEAIVGLRDGADGEQRLVAWVVPQREPPIDAGEIRGVMRSYLPDYMIPSAFIAMERLPLTPNGKVDRLLLPDLASISSPKSEPPQTELERLIVDIWSDVLRLTVGRSDDLLALGADSIQIFQITARARAASLAVMARDLLQHRTPQALAAALDARPAEATALPRLAQFRRDRRLMVAGE